MTHFKLFSLIRNHWESFRAYSVHSLKNICSIDLSGERARSRFTRTCYDHPLNSFLLVTVVIQLLRLINYTETSCTWQCFCSLLLVLLNSTCNICTTISTSSTRFLFLCVCVCVELLILFSKHVNLGQGHANWMTVKIASISFQLIFLNQVCHWTNKERRN